MGALVPQPADVASAEAAAYYEALPREGRLPGRCEMRLPDGLAGARVLDVLCRAGKGAFKLADAVGGRGFVLGCDPDAARMAAAERSRAQAAGRGEGWARRVAFRRAAPELLADAGVECASFDVVYVNASFNAAFRKDAVLRQALEALRPGGTLWIAGVFAASPLPALPPAGGSGNVFWCAWTFRQLSRAAQAAGFADCVLLDAAPVEPDGADADEALAQVSFVAGNARLVR